MGVQDDDLKPFSYKEVEQGKYKIDEYGNVWSNYKQGYLKQQVDKDGYKIISLSVNKNKGYRVRVATLVTLVFIGKPPENMKDPTINHKDNNKTNNHYTNLEWMERGKNSSIRNNKGVGFLNHEAVLNEKQVLEICKLIISTHLTYTQIGSMFSVSKYTISNIVCKKNWKEATKIFGDLKKYRKTYRNKLNQIKSYNPFISQKGLTGL